MIAVFPLSTSPHAARIFYPRGPITREVRRFPPVACTALNDSLKLSGAMMIFKKILKPQNETGEGVHYKCNE
jgi:hypothetical protein